MEYYTEEDEEGEAEMEEQEEEQTEMTSQPTKKPSIIQQIQDIEAMKSPSYQSGQKL